MAAIRVVQAFVLLAIVDLLMLFGTRRLYAAIRMFSKRRVPWRTASIEHCAAAVNEASVWYFHRVLCLQRASTLWFMAHLRGIAVDLVIAYRPVPFQSHAWIEQDGTVVNERPQYQRFFTVLDRL